MGVKIAHFISTSGIYGAERWILALLNHIKGVESLLISTDKDSPELLEEAKKQNIKTINLKIKGNFSILDAAKKLSKLIKKENIDLLHTHNYKSDIIGYLAAKKAGIKIISTPHGWSTDAGLKLKIYESIDRHILKYFNKVIPLSKDIEKPLKKNNNTLLINNFVDLNTIPKPKKGDPLLITYIGQLIERKRVQDLILSLRYIKNKNIKLQIIGDGPKKEELKDLAKKINKKDQVMFKGFRKDRLKLLNDSQTLILPSLLEGIPRTAMEAMAMQKIVIATDIPGNKDLIKHKKTGILIPKRSPKDIAKAISFTIKNKKQAEDMAKNAKTMIQKKYSAKIAAKEYSKVYNDMIKTYQ